MLRILISALVFPILKSKQTNKITEFKKNMKGALPGLPIKSIGKQRLINE